MTTDTKSALLDAAERAARAQGVDGFSYADLAEAVGIRKPSIHYHFPAKSDLSAALMARYSARLRDVCDGIAHQHETGGARLAAFIDMYRAALEGGKSLCLCVAFSTSRDSLPADVIAQIRAFREMMIAWLRVCFDRAVDDRSIADAAFPAMEAAAALSLLEGAQLAARAEENPALFDNAVQLLQTRLR